MRNDDRAAEVSENILPPHLDLFCPVTKKSFRFASYAVACAVNSGAAIAGTDLNLTALPSWRRRSLKVMTFSDLGLAPELLRAIADQGYTDPTPVQAKAIPPILQGQDVMAAAQTGVGSV